LCRRKDGIDRLIFAIAIARRAIDRTREGAQSCVKAVAKAGLHVRAAHKVLAKAAYQWCAATSPLCGIITFAVPDTAATKT
jgi:hypothetical protein